MKVVIGTDAYGLEFVEGLRREFPALDFVPAYSASEQREAARDADVYFGWPDETTFREAHQLQWIACPGTGIDDILAVPEIRLSSVTITNAPDHHVVPMAEWTLAVMLALAHRLPESWTEQQMRVWSHGTYQGRILELKGARLGVFGFGALGRAIAERGLALGMLVHAIGRAGAALPVPNGVHYAFGAEALDLACSLVDWLVVTAPLTPVTSHAIDRRRIDSMKVGAHIVVVSRGGIVDEPAMVKSLKRGHLAGAALDVAETEPPPPDSPLWEAPNLILTPHTSAMSAQMYEGRRQTFRDNLSRFASGEPLSHVCNREAGY